MMATCGFCKREFSSAQGVRAHLKSCPKYQRQRPRSSAAPRPRRATDEERIRRLVESAPSSSRRPTASTAPEPRPSAPRPTPRPESGPSPEARAAARQRTEVAEQAAQQRRDTDRRIREGQTRTQIQHVKCLVVDAYVTFDPIPPEAIAEAKEQIERKLATLPILELPLLELQQIATGVRERIYKLYRQAPAQPSVAALPPRDVTPTPVHNPPQEVTIMPMHKLLTGDFFCPRCDEEFELDRVPEKDAVCADCRVPLEEFAEEDDEGDDEA